MMITSFNIFIYKYGLKNKASSNIKIQQTLSSFYVNDVGNSLGDSFTTDIGINICIQKKKSLVCIP